MILCTAWRWLPVVRAYNQYAQISHEQWLTGTEQTLYAGLGNEIPYPNPERTNHYPIASLTREETEDVLDILSRMDSPYLIRDPQADSNTVEMILIECGGRSDPIFLTLLTKGKCDDAVRLYSDYYRVGRNICATCDNYTAVHDELLTYLCSLDGERYGSGPVIIW